jgi:molybdate transport system substrate-binding protein
VDDLIASGHVDAASRAVVATNDLVLIAPASSNTDRGLTFASLDALPAGEKLAIGEPGAVPAGQYARDALMKLRKWEALDGRMVFGGNVAEVLAYARRGEVAAAIVYATEIGGIDDVVLLDKAEGDWAPTPEVVVGVVKGGKHAKQATRLFEFVASAAGRKILADHGFGPA